MDRDSIDRIRGATFPIGRRGYEKREVDRFLNQLADWLETGGADQTRSELVRRELERVAQKTGKILSEAHEAGEEMRTEVEKQAHADMADARRQAEAVRDAADRYSTETRADADAYSEERYADADEYAEQTVRRAEAEAERIVDEGNRRRQDTEAVISDLEERRDAVLAELERLASEVAGTATMHRPSDAAGGSDSESGADAEAEPAEADKAAPAR